MNLLTIDDIYQLWEDIQIDNAVLFLGQDYQHIYLGNNYFLNGINSRLCKNKFSNPNYVELWKFLAESAYGKKTNIAKARLSPQQKEVIHDVAKDMAETDKLKDVLSIGWSSIMTSAVDPGIISLINCNPVYDSKTVVAGLGNKRKLHVSYLCGCTQEIDTMFDGYRFAGSFKTNAVEMIGRIFKDAIRYSGSLIIDGWNPKNDWITASSLLGSFDADVMYPRIYIFSADDSIIDYLSENEDTELLTESDRISYSTESFYDFLQELIEQKKQEDAARDDIPSEVLTFNIGKRTESISIPFEALRSISPDSIHVLTPKDRIQMSFDSDGLRGVTTKFLSNTGDDFPYWQGYLQGCYFQRNIYTNKQKSGLKDVTIAALTSGNLHQAKSMIVLQGPSNSGKSVLLGKLALELSATYPVVFIKGDLDDSSDLDSKRYASLVNFIDRYLSTPCREKRINRGRVVIIWDNNAFSGKLFDYEELHRELSNSNAVLICSSYQSNRQANIQRKQGKNICFVNISSKLDTTLEIPSLYSMLDNNLGEKYGESLKEIRHNAVKRPSNSSIDRNQLLTNDDRLLSLIQRIFKHDQDQGLAQISLEAQLRTKMEAGKNDDLLKEILQEKISHIEKIYETDMQGLAEIAKEISSNENQEEEWYQEIVSCAPMLNDIIAVAGQFGIRLPLNLVISTIESCYPNLRGYEAIIIELLQNDSMLEVPFPRDSINELLIGYRSPDEADIYLNKYPRRPINISENEDADQVFREDREVDILKRIITQSDISDYLGTNFFTLKSVKELIDQFGPNSLMGKEFAKRYEYKYNEISTYILDNGGDLNPEMALTAAFLQREQLKDKLFEKINNNKDIGDDELQALNRAEESLSKAIEIETSSGSDNSTRLMRLYVEWCTNRNYTFHRENPTIKDIELYHIIHNRFMIALRIYLAQKDNKMNSNDMMDVYLNSFINYSKVVEKIYGLISFPEHADKKVLNRFNNEIGFVMTWIVGKLLDLRTLSSDRTNLTNNLKKVYDLAKSSTESLKREARAFGSGAFILLEARMMWIDYEEDSSVIDYYLESDYSDGKEPIKPQLYKSASAVYDYLSKKENLSLILAAKKHTDTEVACLEMLIRSAWIKKTGNVPFTLDQKPCFNKQDWDELHKYCELYIHSNNDKARYGFAFFFEGIYSWVFTQDVRPNAYSNRPSSAYFEYCRLKCYKPKGLNYYDDSYIYLCALETDKPIVFQAVVKKSRNNRDLADITRALNANDINGMPFVVRRDNIYTAYSLMKDLNFNSSSQLYEITIRFNLRGALSGPVVREEDRQHE